MSKLNALVLAIPLIKRYEGCHRVGTDGLIYPYICPAGYPTQGYGMLVKDMSVRPITMLEAEAQLANAVPHYMALALKHSPVLAHHPRKLAAITSFVFNLGATAYKSSTLRRRVDEEDWAGAAVEIKRWNKGGGRILKGLMLRREAEAAMLEGDDYDDAED